MDKILFLIVLFSVPFIMAVLIWLFKNKIVAIIPIFIISILLFLTMLSLSTMVSNWDLTALEIPSLAGVICSLIDVILSGTIILSYILGAVKKSLPNSKNK